VQAGTDRSVLDGEGDAGQKDPVEKALHDRRKSKVPDGINQYDSVRGKHAVDIGGDGHTVFPGVVIVQTLFAAENRVEPLRVKITIIDLMAGFFQGLDGRLVQGRLVACLYRVGENDKNTHSSSTSGASR